MNNPANFRMGQPSCHGRTGMTQHRAVVYSADIKDLWAGGFATYEHPALWIEHREEAPLPIDSLRIRPVRLGICGTDLHLMEVTDRELVRCTSPFSIPSQGRIIGHEGVAIVEEIGAGVRGFQVGDYVCSESIQTCGYCKHAGKGNSISAIALCCSAYKSMDCLQSKPSWLRDYCIRSTT